MMSILNKQNLKRTVEFRKNSIDERYLYKINDLISNLKIPIKNNKDFPVVFVVGPPRSGTTLTIQLLINALKFKFINNLTARFWSKPEVGILLSNILKLGYEGISYKSNYGKTYKLNEPHEFFYFWEENLKLKQNIIDHRKNTKNINWNFLKRKLNRITYSLNAPVIYKGIYPGFYAKEISSSMNNTFFVYVKRKFIDNALSIYKARKDYYGTHKIWWGTHPENYQLLKKKDIFKQITGQILSLRKSYDEELNKIENKITISYEDLCKNPNKVIENVRESIKKKLGFKFKQHKISGLSFQIRKKNNKQIKKKFNDEIIKLQIKR